jgi:hypothetical protein
MNLGCFYFIRGLAVQADALRAKTTKRGRFSRGYEFLTGNQRERWRRKW